MTIADILSSPCWGGERLVSTRKGPMFVKTMPAQGWHYDVQRSNFDAFRAAGLSFGSSKTGKPELCLWRHDEGYQDREDASRAADASLAIPAPSGMSYLPFQKAGVSYALAAKEGVIIADEMGLGKTVQAIGVLNMDLDWRFTVIICPASLKINWRNELQKWLIHPTVIHVASSKPEHGFGERFFCDSFFDQHEGGDGGEEGYDIHGSGDPPVVLGLDAFDSAMGFHGSSASQTAKPLEELNKPLVRVGEANLPRSPRSGNPPLPVDDTSHVRKSRNVRRSNERRGKPAKSSQRNPIESFVVIPDRANPEVEDLGDLGRGSTRVKNGSEFGVRGKAFFHRRVLIVNYDILPNWMPVISQMPVSYLCVDEAHYIKSKDASRTKHTLSIESSHFIALTGTPLMNKPVELWTLLHRAAPTVFPDYFRFVKRYCNAFKEEKDMGRKGTRSVWNVTGASNLGELQKIMRQHCMIRRLKKDVLKELPKKRRQVIELPPTSAMKVVMDRENAAWKLHEETIAAFATRRAKALIADDEQEYKAAVDGLKSAWQVAFKDMAKVRKETALAKLPLVEQHLIDVLESEDKVIVFAHHREVLDQLEQAAIDRGWNPIKIDGGVSPHLRQGLVEKFQKDHTCRIAVLSIMAAGVGLTLTAACVEVFAEMDWNPALLSQAEDRAHRIGQTNPVLVQHMVLEASLDAKMIRTVMKKQAIADAALDKKANRPAAGLAAGDSEPPAKASRYREIGGSLNDDKLSATRRAMQLLCENDKDRASAANGKGFNRFDSGIGHELNKADRWTAGQMGFAYQLARKYRTQLPTALLKILDFETAA